MPMKTEELKKYKGYKEDEVKIARFLDKNKGNGFTVEEIRKGIGEIDIAYTPDEKGSLLTLQNVSSFTVNVLDRVLFTRTLREMAQKGKISVSEVSGEKYYFID